MHAARVVERLVAAYNARNANAFAAYFTVDAQIVEYPGWVLDDGLDAILATYCTLFTRLQRSVAGGRIIVHGLITRDAATPPFAVLTIYSVGEDGIERTEFLSGGRAYG